MCAVFAFLNFCCAALCYRSAKVYDKAIEAFERAADSYYKSHAYPFHYCMVFTGV
jgi:hypothetical protein